MKLTDEELEKLAEVMSQYGDDAYVFLCGMRREIPCEWIETAKKLFPENFEYQEYLRLKDKYKNKVYRCSCGYINYPPLTHL